MSSLTIRVQVRKMVKRPEKVLIGLADDSPDSVWIIFDPRLRAPKKRDASRGTHLPTCLASNESFESVGAWAAFETFNNARAPTQVRSKLGCTYK